LILDQLKDSLRKRSSLNFKFDNWSRVVKYRWALKPLSAEGSTLTDAGGRFNIGDIDPNRFPAFPALYLGEDAETALKEVFGKKPQQKGLDALDFSLTNPDSYSLVRVQGQLEMVLDLTHMENLRDYFELIKKIKFPKYVETTAKILKLQKPRTIKNLSELKKSLLEPNWRIFPMQYDIPANSQILGQIVENAGIQGVLYLSVQGGKKCLAVFPRNLENSTAFVQLMDPLPEGTNIESKLDMNSWKKLV